MLAALTEKGYDVTHVWAEASTPTPTAAASCPTSSNGSGGIIRESRSESWLENAFGVLTHCLVGGKLAEAEPMATANSPLRSVPRQMSHV